MKKGRVLFFILCFLLDRMLKKEGLMNELLYDSGNVVWGIYNC